MTGHDWQNHSPLPITLRDSDRRIRDVRTTNGVLRAQVPRGITAPGLAISDQRLSGPRVVHHPRHHGLAPLRALSSDLTNDPPARRGLHHRQPRPATGPVTPRAQPLTTQHSGGGDTDSDDDPREARQGGPREVSEFSLTSLA
jgi:hypothetical protein